jgi:hypothetical protein
MTITELEAEGWLEVATGTEYYVVASKQVDNRWIEIGYDTPTQHLQILRAYEHPAGFKTRETIYNGKCPDITTFNHLSNLLEL